MANQDIQSKQKRTYGNKNNRSSNKDSYYYQNIEGQTLQLLIKGRENVKPLIQLFLEIKHQSEGTRKNHQIPGLEIRGVELQNVKGTNISIVVGVLGTVMEKLENHLKTTEIPIVVSFLQKAAFLGAAYILRRVLRISEVG